ncbi:fibronectin type III domain-containing protein [Haliangium ochraceum]|uniref:Fibronectin type III domain protein n=1 Tax=Haliangium ochraceum (strain DSM 14365 / JCM 11303 / SMP-2) TaxID=502025 RepID=D0LXD3_HALO1|nr:fibronectin type III domain-containing protein [Haliangium ochraceum]ACY16175.1 Fibronectin type III domain protein [Haliangium ochraceum DSM 14365]
MNWKASWNTYLTSSLTTPSRSLALLLALSASALPACGGDDDPPTGPDAAIDASFANVQALFTEKCSGSGCHVGFDSTPAAGLDLRPEAGCSSLLQVNALEVPEEQLLVPGKPEDSYLYCKLDADCEDLPDRAQLMPFSRDPLSGGELALVRLWIAGGADGCTLPADDTTPPSFAGAKTATGQSLQVELSWDAAADDVSRPEDIEYLVFQAEASGQQAFAEEPVLVTAAGATSAVVDGLALDTQYFFVVRARDEAGNVDENTAEVDATTLAIADNTPPTFAGASAANALGASTVEVSWSAASDDVTDAGEIVYSVYVAETTGGQNFGGAPQATATGATSTVVRGLRAGSTYFIVVRAEDGAGNQDTNTAEVQVTTEDDIFFPQDIEPVLVANCTSSNCHDNAAPREGLSLTAGNAYGNLVNQPAAQCDDGRERVDPGDATNSYIIHKLRNQNTCKGGAMPAGGPDLPDEVIATFEQWIAEGAPEN